MSNLIFVKTDEVAGDVPHHVVFRKTEMHLLSIICQVRAEAYILPTCHY